MSEEDVHRWEPSAEDDDPNRDPPEPLDEAKKNKPKGPENSEQPNTASVSEKTGSHPSIKLYEVYRSYVEHEDDLVNQRLYRLFIAHASLAAAAGVIISKLPDTRYAFGISIVLFVFGILSIALCINQLSAINAGLRAIGSLNDKWNKVGAKLDDFNLLPELVGGGNRENDRLGQSTARWAPIILGLFWVVVLICAVVVSVKDLDDRRTSTISEPAKK